MGFHEEMLDLIRRFQEGYRERDIGKLEEFMNCFTDTAEVIGTNGSFPGEDEWHLDKDGARELVRGDWEEWGDLRIRLDAVRIREKDGVGWISMPGTVTKRIGEENYEAYLEYAKDHIAREDIPAKQRLHNILRGGTNTIFELSRGNKFIWPVRITAVAVREDGACKFDQMCFSFSTIYFPDVRVFEA